MALILFCSLYGADECHVIVKLDRKKIVYQCGDRTATTAPEIVRLVDAKIRTKKLLNAAVISTEDQRCKQACIELGTDMMEFERPIYANVYLQLGDERTDWSDELPRLLIERKLGKATADEVQRKVEESRKNEK